MFKIHFLNVGHGDCAILQIDGKNMMIDINNGQILDESTKNELMESFSISPSELIYSSLSEVLNRKGYNVPLTNPIEYMKDLGIDSLFRFVLTHPHMDHMTGFYNMVKKENIDIINFWHSGVELEKPDFSNGNSNQEDWDTYIEFKNSDKEPKNIVKNSGDRGEFWTNDGIEILSPTVELKDVAVDKNKINLCSYVLLVTYKNFKFVLAGDAEKENWDYIIENYSDKIADVNILKAAHHGRDSGFHEEAVKLMNPEYTIVSVGKKPQTDAHNKYKKYTREKVLSTRYRGDITVTVDDKGKGNIEWKYNENI